MPRRDRYVQAKELLNQLQLAMTNASLWATTAPSELAMQSTAPFACDHMFLEQWLQFIFIPKLTHIITHEQSLPNKVAIYPMAEIMFKDRLNQCDEIMKLLFLLDQLMGKGKH